MALGSPALFFGKVAHSRLFLKRNGFSYGIYYLAFSLADAAHLKIPFWIGVERRGLLSFFSADHGARDGTSLEGWARGLLQQFGFKAEVTDITLLTLPRVLGYVFNPVSFWLCRDLGCRLVAVLCEVNNTFGETHTYLCAHDDARPILPDDVLRAQKLFHVSPFLERAGHYDFRFADMPEKLGIWIDFYDADGRKKLQTSLVGRYSPLTRQNVARAFFLYPFVTFVSIIRIHWHALKLLAKGIKYIPKPKQNVDVYSAGHTKPAD